ncbi:MAG: hypothetical protein PSN36_04210 [Gammaproteobacteria bacterium]|nr:hypothetical protein [Gammaproteobacteria bacterium]
MSKKIKIILTASLLLNILLIGSYIGMIVKKQWHGHHRAPLHIKFSNSLKHLPSAQQQLKEKLQVFQQQETINHKKIKQLYSDIFNLLLEPVFDSDLYEEKNQQLMQLKQQKHSSIKNFTQKAASSLNQQQRKTFFGNLKKCNQN